MADTSTSQSVHVTASTDQARGSSATGQIVGQYQLEEKIGEGGMGCVYRATHTKLKKTVVVKVLAPLSHVTPTLVQRFHQEMEAIGRLEHPNLVRATDANEDQGRYYLVMDYVEGQDLAKILHVRRTLSIPEACAIVCQVAEGLQYLADKQLVHRDIKPSNLLLTPQGQIKILDLGLALLQRSAGDDEELTNPGQIMGTWDYIAPEQALDSHKVDSRADIYSLGCTFYKFLAGRAPFAGESFRSSRAKARAHLELSIPPVRQFRPEVPPEVAAILQKMLAKRPEDRYQAPREVVAALAPFATPTDLSQMLAVESVSRASASSTTDRLSRLTSTFRGRPWAAALLLGLIVTLGVVALLFMNRRQDLPEPAPKIPPVVKHPPPLEPAAGLGELEPGVWHPLMRRPPSLLHWSKNLPPPQWDQGREVIVAGAPGDLGILGLGMVPGQSNYRFRAAIFQNPWAGRVGLVFGYQWSVLDDVKTEHYQALVLNVLPDGGMRIERTHTRRDLPGAGETRLMVQERVDKPRNHQEYLEIEVHGSHLLRAYWGQQQLKQLCLPNVNAKFNENDYAGALGLLCHDNTVVFRDAQVMILER